MTQKMKSQLDNLFQIAALATIALLTFTATAWAAGTATGDESLLELVRPVIDAFRGGHYVAGGALALVFAIALVRRYAPGKVGKFVHSDAGGVLTALTLSFASTIAAYTSAGQSWKWSMLGTAGGIAFAAAGGYAMIKKLIVEPLLASSWYQNKAPAWMKASLRVVLWIFDKPAAAAETIKEAEAAGEAAVKANPSSGANGVAGEPEKF